MLVRGYIDESYGEDQNIFTLSGVLAKGSDWREIERKWNLHLNAKNKQLKRENRPLISRYHASDCSGRHGEFKGWTHDERDAFVLGLFQVFKQVPTFTVAIDVQLDELCDVFPEWSGDRLGAGYDLLTMFIMIIIGNDFAKFSPKAFPPKITLFHDRTGGDGKYDPTILRAFNRQINDPTFPYSHYFASIAPLTWKDCIALQPADLVAFECFKEADARLEARKPRKSYRALLDMNTFGIHSKTFNKEALQEVRKAIDGAIKCRKFEPPSIV